MKNTLVILAAIAAITACSSTNYESAPMNEPTTASASNIEFIPGEGVIIEEMLETRATVVDIDKENRILTIVDADDVVSVFNVTEAVRNFDQISVGESVVLQGYEGLVMQLAEPGGEFEDTATKVLARAEPGEKPAMVEVEVVTALAEITDINSETRMVTVTGPKGNSVELIVPEHIEGFDKLKIGDKVNAAYAQAFAISVQVVSG